MADLHRPPPPKKDVALALLEGPSVFVHLDPRRPGVVVPKWFIGQPQLVLQVGLNMAIPIPDLKVDEDGVSCTLSFSRTPFWCSIPWSAVYALVGENGRGMVWQDDVPPELASQMQQKMGSQPQKPARKQRAKLAAVDAPDAESGRAGSPRARAKPEAARDEAEEPAGEAPTRAKPGEREAARPSEKPSRAPEARPSATSPASPARRDVTPSPTKPAAPSGQKKPKRELPPYLRVIK